MSRQSHGKIGFLYRECGTRGGIDYEVISTQSKFDRLLLVQRRFVGRHDIRNMFALEVFHGHRRLTWIVV